MSTEAMVNISGEDLHKLMKDKFLAAGLPEDQAEETANHLTYANLIGVHSHGAVRVEYYAERIAKGGINTSPNVHFEQTGDSTGIFHGDNAQGHYVCNLAIEPTVKLAKEKGAAVVGVSKCGHTGTLSYYLRKIANEGLLVMAMTPSDPMVVPFGGAERFYGTNPIGFGAPTNDEDPVIFDMATTVQAWGKVLDARSRGESIPDTWAVDDNGNPTTDPNHVAGLVPIAGPKGYGLMMMVDVFTNVLLGLPFGDKVTSMYDDLTAGRDLSQTYIAIDPEKFVGLDNFKATMSQTVKNLNNVKPADGFDQVLYPGQNSTLRYKQSLKDGVDIPKNLIDYLKSDDVHFDNYDGLDAFAQPKE